ncbi:hypothetical protein [Leifsonia sp. Leaf264]|uniref:hypothetical protein n=1 Tax=Leifsonia sp. Leaf264 TaxID=1736314 RepID=UPI0006FDDE2A|nr:hypothetical protein [Leifsonia sp. Leaf264]KQO98385.1 hypothetical protein ASF30_10010 [Leifsonia sp. Leaf264]
MIWLGILIGFIAFPVIYLAFAYASYFLAARTEIQCRCGYVTGGLDPAESREPAFLSRMKMRAHLRTHRKEQPA